MHQPTDTPDTPYAIPEKTEENNPIENEYTKELQLYYMIETLAIACLVAIAIATTSYILTIKVMTTVDATIYMLSLLISPSAYFLLTIHIYTMITNYIREKKSTSLTLDITYFSYILLAGGTILSLYYLYTKYNIVSKLFTPGWNTAVLLLFAEVILVFYFSYIITKKILAKKFPHFVSEPKKRKKKKTQLKPQRKHIPQNHFTTAIKHRADISLWQDHECFTKY
ncbi:MAG: hypothetical protein NT038_00980 [Euryarchaeota archaeon]|nr:hypothetical protein [Euryarchaeota archaeon]